jgi:hypothetical protein
MPGEYPRFPTSDDVGAGMLLLMILSSRGCWSHYNREGHHWRFKTPLHWQILNRHNQLSSDELITSLPVMPNRQ